MNTLFNEDIVETSQQQGPVTVLGITFASDDERRAYFREELRKKLPELKHIEGFPIGEDDDIVNLSDPPYYTACPNPWINEFIAEWEDEKNALEQQGKRQTEFDVDKPYASDVSEGKNNPIYMAHAYHTKVPHPAIMRYILHYTQPGDIVFDGFAGTGMTGVASQLCGSEVDVHNLKQENSLVGIRHSICSDLSPIATLIAANYNLKFNARKFEADANRIISEVEQKLGWMYETNIEGQIANINYVIWSDVFICPNCNHELVLWTETVDLEGNKIKDSITCPVCSHISSKKTNKRAIETVFDNLLDKSTTIYKKVPVRVNYVCGRKRGEKDISISDIEKIAEINAIKSSNYIGKIPDGDESGRNILNDVDSIHQLFTYRNFLALSEIYENVKDNIILLLWFTSTLQNASKMYKFRLDRKGGIVSGTMFIPSLNIEQNVFKLLRGKIHDISKIAYDQRGHSITSLLSATNLATIKDNSIDYIFTDPPFGSNIMYSELSSLWEGWIKVMTNTADEAIVNRSQNKSLFLYQKLMSDSFDEFYRILKPGKWITIEFSNTSASVWNSIQTALQNVGFVVANVAGLDKKQGSFKTVNTTTAVKQDLVITCFKPSSQFVERIMINESYEGIWGFVEELLSHLPVHIKVDNATTAIIERSPKILYDRLIAFYVQRSLPVPIDAGEFQKGLKERFLERDGMYFNSSQVIEYDEKRKGTTEFYHASLFVSSEQDGVMWLKDQLKDSSHTYQELQPKWMQAIAGLRKGDILPELRDLLHENFLQNEDGAWYLPDMENEIDLEKVRTNRLLKQFAAYKELASKPKAKIKEVRVEALRVGFKQCYKDKDFLTIVTLSEKIPNNLLMEDDVLLQYYDIASTRVDK